MKSYRELIEQTFEFPQKEFKVRDHELLFNDVPLMDIINQYGTPLKLTYLPRISENIRYVQATFNNALERCKYNAKYTYCYCTKSSHFSFIMPLYRQYISELLNDDFNNCIPILDNLGEIDFYEENVKVPYKVGIRVAA